MFKILYFTAKWCAPCHYFERVVENVLEEPALERYFSLTKVDVDVYPDLMNKYEIMAVPTIVIVDDSGNVLGTVVGAKTSDEFRGFLRYILNKYLK